MEYFDGKNLRKALNKDPRRFSTDHVVMLIRRAAEALKEFHELERGATHKRGEIGELGFGPMSPEDLFYDERLDRVDSRR